jgi:hypothetical protein
MKGDATREREEHKCRVRVNGFAPVIGKPYEGEPHVRFDEGAVENALWLIYWGTSQTERERQQIG